MISGNMVGSYSQFGKTFILTDENGNELTGVVVGQKTVFTANAAEDIREGKVAATDEGVVTGKVAIPNYETTEGYKIITAGSPFSVTLSRGDRYDYTRLQVIICNFNTTILNSVSSEKVSIEDSVYEVNSTTSISSVVRNAENKSIDLGISNDTDNIKIMRYFTYREIL